MKKSSDNTNRPRKLEEVFRDGFEPAEVTPRASIWHRIEQELEVKQAGYYKKRLAWYRSLAAASITLLVLAISYFWYDTQTSHRVNFPSTSSPNTATQHNNISSPPKITESEKLTPTHQPSVTTSVKPNLPTVIGVTEASPANGTASPAEVSAINKKLAAVRQARVEQSRQSLTELKNLADLSARKNITPESSSGFNTDSLKTATASEITKHTSPSPVAADSSQLAAAEKSSLFKNDSAAAFTAAVKPKEAKKNTNTSRWALGGGTGSQYFEQNIKFANAGNPMSFTGTAASYANSVVYKNVAGNSLEAASKEFDENTRSAFSYRAAVAANYRLNDKWSLEAGLIFAENKAQTTTTYIIYKKPAALNNIPSLNSGSSNFADKQLATNVTIPVTIFLAKLTDNYLNNSYLSVDKVDPFTMYYRYRQLGVPVKLRYQQGRGKWFNFVQAGGAINVLLQTSILSDSPKVPEAEYTIGQASPFRKWYFTALGSVGRGLKLSEVWQMQGSLDVARNFSALTLSPDQIPNVSQHKSYYVGFGISTSYVIGKKTDFRNK